MRRGPNREGEARFARSGVGRVIACLLVCAVGAGCGRIDYDPLQPSGTRDGAVGMDGHVPADAAAFDGSRGDGGARDGAVGGMDGTVGVSDGSTTGMDGTVGLPEAGVSEAGPAIDAGASGGVTCPLTSGPNCPNNNGTLSAGVLRNLSGSTAGDGNGLSGSCGGAGAEESTNQFLVLGSGTYHFSWTADHDTAVYVLSGGCTGSEMLCMVGRAPGGGAFDLTLTSGSTIIVVVDGLGNRCGNYMLTVQG